MREFDEDNAPTSSPEDDAAYEAELPYMLISTIMRRQGLTEINLTDDEINGAMDYFTDRGEELVMQDIDGKVSLKILPTSMLDGIDQNGAVASGATLN